MRICSEPSKPLPKNKISLDKPIKELSPAALNILLHGNAEAAPDDALEVDDEPRTSGGLYEGPFEGIIPMLKRWFGGNGSSEGLREWVEKFMELKQCEPCGGARLKQESLWFKVDGKIFRS